ncbi:MAG: BCD family MFS transporter [Gemmatimonadota bacterium]|nr:BCD family MFS transporter [Gemmatimonadota bacterium]
MTTTRRPFGWRDVARLGLAQIAIGAVAAVMTSTLNRVMVVELALPATVPSVLVALHFVIQMSRARFGFDSDRSGHRAPWILGGVVTFAVGGFLAALGVALAATRTVPGLGVAFIGYALIGVGMSAAGTALLAHVAEEMPPQKLGGAAAMLWIMMILGIAVTAGVSGQLLDPFSFRRLLIVIGAVCAIAVVLASIAAWGSWHIRRAPAGTGAAAPSAGFGTVLRDALADRATRRFALFVFAAMLAYSAQDLILEPFAGRVFGMTPGESTKLGGTQHGGVMLGMLGAALLSARFGSLRHWAVGGCLASALTLVAVAQSPALGGPTALSAIIFCLGVANGVFAVGAIGAMMAMTAADGTRGTGIRLGVYGAAQAIAYAAGSLGGGVASDLTIAWFGEPARGYTVVFAAEAVLFVIAAAMAMASTPSVRGGLLRRADAGDAILGAMR